MMRVRKALLFVVMLGALSLSFHGQVASVTPQLGLSFAVVFALSYDVATLLALHEAMNPTASRRVKRWAWAVLIQAGGTALGLNTWYGLVTGTLPSPIAVAIGAGPVMLAWTLSHLFALVLAERAKHRTGNENENGAEDASHAAPAGPSPKPGDSPAKPTSTSASGRVLPGLESAGTRQGSAGDPVAASVGSAVSGGDALVDRAERLERQALATSGGKQGISYRKATRQLRVRYPTARAALDAARSRITNDTTNDTDHNPIHNVIHDTDTDHTDALTSELADRLGVPSSNGAASS